jgi:hypothetical protein
VGTFVEDVVEAARRIAARSPNARLDPPLTLITAKIRTAYATGSAAAARFSDQSSLQENVLTRSREVDYWGMSGRRTD